ncbi:hypothetical protein BDC45DRAFT_496671 [Circinella umbellata]|nr:hypothetical protein BDC45DRAFT_496671 [Circinella umbellata]
MSCCRWMKSGDTGAWIVFSVYILTTNFYLEASSGMTIRLAMSVINILVCCGIIVCYCVLFPRKLLQYYKRKRLSSLVYV